MKVNSIIIAMALFLVGCSADRPLNPSFPLTLADAKIALGEMTADPKPLERPLVVLGGIFDPGIASSSVAGTLRRMISTDDVVISASFFWQFTFDECRDRVIERIEEAFPSDDPKQTIEVDVVAISMGGLVARHAARPRDDGGRRLQIRRLFTLSTPHRGANLASLPTFDRRAIDMRSGSAFLEELEQVHFESDYEIYPYSRLGDSIVGVENTAPTGQFPWWVPNIPGSFSHLLVMDDPRLLADIARRLRGETPFTSLPATAPPGIAIEEAITHCETRIFTIHWNRGLLNTRINPGGLLCGNVHPLESDRTSPLAQRSGLTH